MTLISIRLTREENATYYGVSVGDCIQEDLERYVAGVVASEIGNSALEACRAQAVAARTFAVKKGVLKGSVITDSSASDQAYRASRYDRTVYPNAVQAATDTAGEILTYHGQVISAVYSACNGGRTVSAKTRWGSERAYLIEQEDPWDNSTKRTGHGVGMSQRGAKAMAAAGKTFGEILAFYYPGTDVTKLADKTEGGGTTGNKEGIRMDSLGASAMPPRPDTGGMHMISAKRFVEQVKIPLAEGWGYIYGTHGILWTAEKQAAATREQTRAYGAQWVGHMVTDCSGLVYWACLQLGEKTVHHATYLYTDWSKKKGKLIGIPENEAGETKGRDDGQAILPGTLVFLKGSMEKIHHVGVYIGNNTVIEAKGTKSGVVTSELSHWEYWGELKVIDYTGAQAPESEEKPMSGTIRAIVNNPHTWLNVRSEPKSGASIVFKVQKGTVVDVTDITNGEWWQISYNGKTGYAAAEYLLLQETPVEVEIKLDEPEPIVPEEDLDWQDEEALPEEPEETGEPAQKPQKVSMIDRIMGLFGRRKEKKTDAAQAEPEEGTLSPEAVVGALKTVIADLEILTQMTNDAMENPNADALIGILAAMDKVLPQIEEAKNELWELVSVG